MICLSWFDTVTNLRGILVFLPQYLEYYRVSLEALILRFIVRDAKLSCMLKNTDNIRVTRILVNTVECTVAQRFILSADVGFVHPDFDLLLCEFRKIGERHVWSVEEFGKDVFVKCLLILVVCFDINYLHSVRVWTAGIILSTGTRTGCLDLWLSLILLHFSRWFYYLQFFLRSLTLIILSRRLIIDLLANLFLCRFLLVDRIIGSLTSAS